MMQPSKTKTTKYTRVILSGGIESLDTILKELYASEINVCISWLWDGGINVMLGDDMNGYVAHANFDAKDADQIGWWLKCEVDHHFPDSKYAVENGYDG